MAKNSRDLTRGGIPPMLLRLTLPMLMGMVSMTLFNLADTMYVGWLGSRFVLRVVFGIWACRSRLRIVGGCGGWM